MSDVTQILSEIEQGDPQAAEKLLPLVYEELRKLAATKLAHEKPGQTLQSTALVHEAYLRLVGDPNLQWNSRGHFFGAAAEAMRRILVESARRKARARHGGDRDRIELEDVPSVSRTDPRTVLAVDEALAKLSVNDPSCAKLVKLHFFAGLTVEEAADVLGMSRATAFRLWSYGRAFLRLVLSGDDPKALA